MSRGAIIPLLCVLAVGPARSSANDAGSGLTDADKRAGWVGQKVTILGTGALACPIDGKAELFYLRGDDQKKGKRLLASAYVGQRGVVVEAGKSGPASSDVVVQLDKTGERVTVSFDHGLAFDGEMEAAKSLVGRSLWSKGPQTLTPEGELCLPLGPSRGPRLELNNLQKVTVVRAEMGHHLEPAYLLLQTEDGKRGWLTGGGGYDSFDDRYLVSAGHGVPTRHYSFRFHTEDPRAPHADWTAAEWQLVEKGELAVGMTEQMAALSCGRAMATVPPASEGPAGTSIHECNCEKYLVENGKLARFVEIPEPKLAQDIDGFDLGIVSVERKGMEWQSGGLIYRAKKNAEVVAVRFRLKRTGDRAKFEIGPPELTTSDGTKAESPTSSFFLELGQSCRRREFDLPFGVVKGARLKTLRIGGFTFDLERLGAI